MRKNPATAVSHEEYEILVNTTDANEYDENPKDRTEWDDDCGRIY